MKMYVEHFNTVGEAKTGFKGEGFVTTLNGEYNILDISASQTSLAWWTANKQHVRTRKLPKNIILITLFVF